MRNRQTDSPGTRPTRLRRSSVPLIWVAAGLAAVAQAWAGFDRPWSDRLSDLQVYLGGVRTWVAGGSLYDFAAAGTEAPFTYPPFAGLVFYPLVHVNTTALMAAWTVLTAAAVLAVALIARRTASITWRTRTGTATAVAALLLFLSAPVSSNLRFGQVSVFLVLLILLDTLKVVPPKFAGVATGLAAALKLTPLIFIPYLWLAGQRRAAVTALGTFTVTTAFTWLVLFDESLRYWTKELFNVDRVGNIATGGNQSINGALLRLDYPDNVRTATVLALGGAIVIIALYRSAKMARQGSPMAATVIVGAAGLAFSPVSWTHHQVWLLLAAFASVSLTTFRNRAWTVFVAVVMVAPVTSVGAALPGGVVWGNSRLLLAVAIACVVPFIGSHRSDEPSDEPHRSSAAGSAPLIRAGGATYRPHPPHTGRTARTGPPLSPGAAGSALGE